MEKETALYLNELRNGLDTIIKGSSHSEEKTILDLKMMLETMVYDRESINLNGLIETYVNKRANEVKPVMQMLGFKKHRYEPSFCSKNAYVHGSIKKDNKYRIIDLGNYRFSIDDIVPVIYKVGKNVGRGQVRDKIKKNTNYIQKLMR